MMEFNGFLKVNLEKLENVDFKALKELKVEKIAILKAPLSKIEGDVKFYEEEIEEGTLSIEDVKSLEYIEIVSYKDSKMIEGLNVTLEDRTLGDTSGYVGEDFGVVIDELVSKFGYTLRAIIDVNKETIKRA